MLSASMLGQTGPTLHDTARVRANFKCTATICYGVGLIDSTMPSIGKMDDWIRATQRAINQIGVKIHGARWIAIKEDGLIGASTVAAAQKTFSIVPRLLTSGFFKPTSKEQLALWIRGLSFPEGGMFLHHQLRDFAAAMKAPAPTAASTIATAPAPIRVAPTASGFVASSCPAGTMKSSSGQCVPVVTSMPPPKVQSAPSPIPSGPTASLRPQGDAISVAAIPVAASAGAAASLVSDQAAKPGFDTPTKIMFGVGAAVILGLAGIALFGRKA